MKASSEAGPGVLNLQVDLTIPQEEDVAVYEARCAFDVRAKAGECATWSVEEQAFYWVDIHGQSINRIDPETGDRVSWQLPSKPGCFALTTAGGAVVAAQLGIYELKLDTGDVTLVAAAPFDPATHRLNDGGCDRQGRFWSGSMFADLTPAVLDTDPRKGAGKGVYYRYDGRSLTPEIEGITISNGTAFSPNGRIMYRAESYERTIWAYDYDVETGVPSNGRIFAHVPDGLGFPDGAAIDATGGYWSALPMGEEGGWVVRFSPEGALTGQYRIPTRRPSMPAFGGPDLSTLYITSLQYVGCDVAADPYAGGIFTMETDVQGLPATPFKGLFHSK
jgi:sugar lactone lactonase YvrE